MRTCSTRAVSEAQASRARTRAAAHQGDAAAAAVDVRNLVGCTCGSIIVRRVALAARTACYKRSCAPCMAKFTVLHTEHCTLDAPLMYISSVRHPPHSSCAISVPAERRSATSGSARPHSPTRVAVRCCLPAGGTGVMPLHCRQDKGAEGRAGSRQTRAVGRCQRPPRRSRGCMS
jgi:hypothetical protein